MYLAVQRCRGVEVVRWCREIDEWRACLRVIRSILLELLRVAAGMHCLKQQGRNGLGRKGRITDVDP